MSVSLPSPTHLPFPFQLSFVTLHRYWRLSLLQQSLVPLSFPFPDVVITTDASHCAFIFRVQGYLYSLAEPGQILSVKSHTTLQDTQTVLLMLHRRAFCCSHKMIAIRLNNSIANAYMYLRWYSISFKTSLPHIESGWEAWYYSYLSMQLSIPIWKLFIYHGEGCFQNDIFFFTWLEAAFHLGVNWRWICWHPHILIIISIIIHWRICYLWETCSWTLSTILGHFRWVTYFSPALVLLVLSKVSGRTCQGEFSHFIVVVPCWMESSWLSTVLNMLEDIPCWCPIIKDLIREVLEVGSSWVCHHCI